MLMRYHMLQALAYFSIAYFIGYNEEHFGGLLYVLIFVLIQYLMVKLELFVRKIGRNQCEIQTLDWI
jgi:hypothetical protein